MKILLIQPPHHFSGLSRPPAFFPLGLGYIAKQVLEAGHQVEVFDIWAGGYDQQQVLAKIDHADYDMVGITAMSSQYAYVKWLSAELKKRNNNPIVLGSALATLTPEIVLGNSSVDICVISEGEETIQELLAKPDSLDNVAGIYFKDSSGKIKIGPDRKYVKELDSIAFPAWDLFPIEVYLDHCTVLGRTDLKSLNIIAGRGCPYSCHFCSKTFSGARFRSVDNIIQEVKLLKEKYDIKGLFFADELLLVNKRRVYELCDALEPLKLKWCCQGRVNLVEYELLKHMKKAGCVALGYGVESGSQSILNNMKKGTTVEQGVKSLKDTVKLGLRPVVQMMYGYPGESRQTVQETIDFFKRLPYVGYVDFSITTPLPGTRIWEDAKIKGIINNEEEFLEGLAGGYWSKIDRAPTNLTGLSAEEFLPLMRKMEKEIFFHQVLKDPRHFISCSFWDLVYYWRRFGSRKTFVAIVDRFVKPLLAKRMKL